jgi:integrase
VEEAPRERRLEDHEIPIFWSKIKDATMSDYMKTALKLLLVTGQRRGELAHARWEHIDLKGAEWYMPETKNGTDHTVPLSVMAVELFKRLRKETRESAYALPSPHLQIKSSRTPIEDKPIAKRSLTRALAKNREHFGLDHFTVHDLRRTVVTRMSKLKIDQRTIDEVINHLPPKIVRTYGRHDYAPEKKEALEIWEAELERLTEATNAQV